VAVGQSARGVEQFEELRSELAVGNGRAMRGDLTSGQSVPHVDRVLENAFDPPRPAGSRMGLRDLAAAADQMRAMPTSA
jgi:hypothetical protein